MTDLAVIPPAKPSLLLRMLVAGTVTGMGLIGLVYLMFPTGGLLELIPDAIPLVGNMDEAGATAIVLFAASYWGLDVTRWGAMLGAWSQGRKQLPPGRGEADKPAG